ncbi:FlgD immunoglobulin-like domain containing protein [Balneolales bacterium ANBcel1]|nr:FlgD immunoglobulin-like domain containing protein [Balneolales bacterium ANBcel1]
MRHPAIFLLLLSALSALSATGANGQIHPGQLPSPYYSISQNSVSNMGAFGDTLWIGPRLMYNVGNEFDWHFPDEADSIVDGRGRLFSIALARDTIFAGVGYNQPTNGESVQAQMGFYVSKNGGLNWELIDTSRTLDHPDDTTIRYGGQDLDIIPVIVPQQSPPYMVDFRGDVVFFAGWASGIRRSTDFGQTWERVVLPPYGMDELNPDHNYSFSIDPRGSEQSNDYLNFLGFSVAIAADGTVYAGTAGGLNISDNALVAPADSIRWRQVRQSDGPHGLLGSWITSIRENSFDNAVWMTNWIALAGTDREGIVVTRDGGDTFEKHLTGERIYDIGFQGETIYAAGRNGVFISRDNGDTWRQISQIQSPNTAFASNTTYYSVATANDRVWIGSSDGLASTVDFGDTWAITRVNFPLSGENLHQDGAPAVKAYAYPNPFSPRHHDVVRIRFSNASPSDVTIRLYDFGMNLIRTLDKRSMMERGTFEAYWDGTDQQGRKVANGTVFYEIKTGGDRVVGKILLLE